MKKMTEKVAEERIAAYFLSRKVEKRGQDGEILISKNGEIQYEEKPCTVSGLALALGFSSREKLLAIKDRKTKALVDRALLRIEENAEEKLFCKDTFHGAKLFLEANFKRWAGEGAEEELSGNLGVCSVWAE